MFHDSFREEGGFRIAIAGIGELLRYFMGAARRIDDSKIPVRAPRVRQRSVPARYPAFSLAFAATEESALLIRSARAHRCVPGDALVSIGARYFAADFSIAATKQRTYLIVLQNSRLNKLA